jgi:hypothetical protein
MNLSQIKTEIQQYQYLEDTGVIDVTLASIIANRLKLSDPVWLIIIGASSGGKSQIVRPIAMSDTKFIHKVDDVTENTFLSGVREKEGDTSMSLLKRMGNHGIITISDFTVIMSKNSESRNAILSQFRMIYDGEMVKHSGSSKEAIRWPSDEKATGYMGVVAGSTPSIYSSFEEVADMGERFIYYRMKEFSAEKATHLALSRGKSGKALDLGLSTLYADYIQAIVKGAGDMSDLIISDTVRNRIIEIAMFAERVRTPVKTDFKGERITHIPLPAYPMRVSIQMMAIAKALMLMQKYETGDYELGEDKLKLLDWVCWSMANEEKRHVLRQLAMIGSGTQLKTSSISDVIGLDEHTTGLILQNLSAIGIVSKNTVAGADSVSWSFKEDKYYQLVRRIENITDVEIGDDVSELAGW